MKAFAEMPAVEVSPRTQRAVQDYTAINTIITAIERISAGDELARAIVSAFTADDYERENLRLRLNCPLGRRAEALGMLRTGASTRAGVISHKGTRK